MPIPASRRHVVAPLSLTLAACAALLAAPAIAQTAAPAACTAPPPIDGDGEHPVHLELWRVEQRRVVLDDKGPRRDLLQFALQDIGSRLTVPEQLDAVFDPTTALRVDRREEAPAVVLVGYSGSAPRRASPREKDRAAALRAHRDSVVQTGIAAWPVLRGQIRFTLHEDGRVSRVAATRTSVVPRLDSALAAAVQASGAAGALAGAVGRAVPGADSVDLAIDLVADDDTLSVSGMVARVRLPHHRVSVVEPAGPPRMGPRYPEAERLRGEQGVAVMDFVVGVDGSVVDGSLRPRQGTPAFLAAAVPVVPGERFRPATVAGCAVAVEVRQRFEFELVR